MNQRPAPHECADYYKMYIDQVPDGSVVETLGRQVHDTVAFLESLTPGQETYRYAEGKWSPREVVGHLIDAERMFCMRALAFARKDPARLPSFDEGEYAVASNAGERPMKDLAREFATLRASHVAMFGSFPEAAWDRTGIASDNPFTVRSLAWIVAGHEIHHVDVIRTRYLKGAADG